MSFYSAYRHGFARVAACTLHTTIADPAANAESVLAAARECHDDGVALAVFPELTLSGYSIDDLLLQDALLDAVETALADVVVAASADLLPVLVVGAPLRHRNRLYNTAVVIHRGAVLGRGARSRTCRTTASSTSAASSPPATTCAATIAVGGHDGAVRPGPAVRRRRLPGLRGARRDLRGHVGAGAAERAGRAGRRDGAGQPVRQPDHHRPGRRPQAAVPLGVGALPGRLRLRRGRRGRVDHRPGLGRPDHDLRERRRCWPSPSASPRASRSAASPTSTSTCCAQERMRHGHASTTTAAPAARGDGFRRVGVHRSTRRPATSACAATSSASRSCPPTPHGSHRTATRPTTSRSSGLEQRLRAIELPEGRHRRLRRAGLHPRADRRRPGDGPLGPAAHRHPGVHHAGLRHRRRAPRPTPWR